LKAGFPIRPLEFTAELVTSVVEGQIEFEHFHRYRFARDFCHNLDVLDVASGDGYGSAILAGVALSVVGVDVDDGAIAHAREAYDLKNLRFLLGNATDLPLENASVDVVVSFETIEHIREHARFVAEIRRVLRPGGRLIVSTTGRPVYSAQMETVNKENVLGLTEEEFHSLLRDNFVYFSTIHQHAILRSTIADIECAGLWLNIEHSDKYHSEASIGLARAHFLLGVASDVELPIISSSLYFGQRSVHEALTLQHTREKRAWEWIRECDSEQERVRALASEHTAARAALADMERRRWKLALEAEKDRAALTLKRARDVEERARDVEVELNLQELQLNHLSRKQSILVRELIKAYGRPWRPIKYLLNSQILRALGLAVTPFSSDAAARLKQSANKRSPKRFELASIDHRGPDTPSFPPREKLPSADHQENQKPTIDFIFSDLPDVSIIIPVYKESKNVDACLGSLYDCKETEPPFEVILMGDFPSGSVLNTLPDTEGLIRVANRQNLGFLATCNAGADMARGRHLCFLSSDTMVRSGWLRALMETAEQTSHCAIVGPMLSDVNGSIENAGWRILADGRGWPIGKGRSLRDGAYTYRRQVDCVTGACFLVPAKIFKELGGFDSEYEPGLYGEIDFAFRARISGLGVLYEPRSQVILRSDASSGSEKRDELSEANRARFVMRFADTLRSQPSEGTDEFLLRRGVDRGPVMLVLYASVPRPDRHAGDVTMAQYLELLADAGWHIVFGPLYGGTSGPGSEVLERLGVELIRDPETIERWLCEHGKHISEVWLAGPEVAASYLGVVRAYSKASVTYYTHDLHHVRMRGEAELRKDAFLLRAAAGMRLLELGVFLEVDRITTPSELEREEIWNLTMGKTAHVLPPFFYDFSDLRTRGADHFASLSDIVFVGGFPHSPNVDAALFIAREIMPLVWREVDWARLVLIGYAPPQEVLSLAGPRIVVTGHVPDLEPYMDQARVNLAALRFGAGVKGKVVQSLQMGVPVVTTPVGAEGIGIVSGRDAIVAEGQEALAEAVILLLRDAHRCAELSSAGVELVKRKFSREMASLAIKTIFTNR
jgi:GT2 family glycosyltransferase/SAM-dependent methyltransferase/glycosyltransferase involved in cell wall biosynthesis